MVEFNDPNKMEESGDGYFFAQLGFIWIQTSYEKSTLHFVPLLGSLKFTSHKCRVFVRFCVAHPHTVWVCTQCAERVRNAFLWRETILNWSDNVLENFQPKTITTIQTVSNVTKWQPLKVSSTGSLISYFAKVNAYINNKCWLKISTKGIRAFSRCGHL